jgi:hypothetical protein
VTRKRFNSSPASVGTEASRHVDALPDPIGTGGDWPAPSRPVAAAPARPHRGRSARRRTSGRSYESVRRCRFGRSDLIRRFDGNQDERRSGQHRQHQRGPGGSGDEESTEQDQAPAPAQREEPERDSPRIDRLGRGDADGASTTPSTMNVSLTNRASQVSTRRLRTEGANPLCLCALHPIEVPAVGDALEFVLPGILECDSRTGRKVTNGL